LDTDIVASLKGIPNHVTAGVVSGNVYDRFERVIVFFDDVSRETIVEQVDKSLNMLVKTKKECFSAFTSRFKNIEHMMDQQGMIMDPALLMAKLTNAITSSADTDCKEAMRQVRMTVGLPTGTASELLAALAGPMRDREKERKADDARATGAAQQSVNAAWSGRGGKGGRGKGGAGRGSGKPNVCIKFAEGNCTLGDKCFYTHRTLTAAELVALKAATAAKRAARMAGKGGKGSSGKAVNAVRITQAEVINALKAAAPADGTQPGAAPSGAAPAAGQPLGVAERCAELRKEGLNDDQILAVARLMLDAK
jgi:hypothetical protein